ncbi:MAG: aspartyl protease family protein, partial [Acidobacteria bacterium]|nr:aspartyl protease family protein [Acidobacteriota bacterium]
PSPNNLKWDYKMNFHTQSLSLSLLVLLLSLFVQADAQSKKNKVAQIPSLPTPQVRFISGTTALGIPFELSSNLVLVQAKVNDSATVWFIFDTGAESTVIDTELAKTLRLKAHGKTVGTGGAGTAEAVRFKAVSMQLPNIEISNLTIYGLPLDFLSSPLGKKIGGVIGYDIIKEFVVEIDYAAHKINLYKPESYQYSGAGEIFPLTFEENMPFVQARIAFEERAAIDGKFEIDSGSTGAVLFNTPFVKKHQLLKTVSRTNEVRAGGVGGTAQAFLGRIKSIALGRLTLENIVASFSQATRGDYASAKYDGLIGGEILRRFKTIFDYSRRRMILEPNAQFSEPYEIDMSGMELLADGDDLSIVLIDEVKPKSPAAEAGVLGGDVITAIDNRPVKEFTLEQIRQMFRQDGREYLLNLKRDGKVVQAKIKLRRLT